MTMEFWSTVASIGTFVVIGATAIAAIVQLRHMRAGNQIAAVMKLDSVLESVAFREARRFVREELPQRLRDPAYRAELISIPLGEGAKPLLIAGNCYEEMGLFVKRGIIDPAMACDLWSAQVSGDWNQMAPAIAIIRRVQGPATWENWEYLVGLTQVWLRRFPQGAVPANLRLQPLEDVYLGDDAAQSGGKAAQ